MTPLPDELALLRGPLLRRLQGFEVRPRPGGPAVLRRAAVALVVLDEGPGAQVRGLPVPPQWSARPAVLLTRRAATLRRHANQWALPGGAMDEGEAAEAAALRELHEETGLALAPEAVLGRLDDYVTRSGYAITPVVVWGGAVPALAPNPQEVASVHRIRLQELMRDDAPILNRIPQSEHPVLRMPVGASWIAAPTAAILYQFREVGLAGRDTRVAHFEQPVFAWK
ncbi:NUDIX hydrolase [Pseudorhodoferax sp.]|uniref:NUDIX hydrolase n=1 Tax=Pseudorhodoferax sp. TaxID=1993553 RepID=UPI002DD6526E|nr:CoA pyrophosphatase [Pseudorhodoferax sp.]